ncbi:Dimethyl sulfoxide reductase chain B [Escherichia coli]|nr:Dimethyl sulfoxide reductase chain B [Escherichia coli]
MTTQYGFFIDSSRCTGCKTCELACKDFKDLGPEVSFRRIYEYAGGDWQEDNGVWHQNVFAIISPSPVTIAMTRMYKSLPQRRNA